MVAAAAARGAEMGGGGGGGRKRRVELIAGILPPPSEAEEEEARQRRRRWTEVVERRRPLGSPRAASPVRSAAPPGPPGGKGGGGARSEWGSMALLVLLYTLQGVPLGIAMGSVPFLLQKALQGAADAAGGGDGDGGAPAGSSSVYGGLALFSLSAYPYSLKLFWSPLVDTFYVDWFGRRKSWVVPAQAMIGATLLWMSTFVEASIARGEVGSLAAVFFALVVMVATQDIAVDGWAISMLSKPNRHYGSTCQSVGQNIGFFASYSVFLALNSADFSNKYLRDEPLPGGVLTLSAFLRFWGLAFLGVTLAIALFRSERPHAPGDDGSDEDEDEDEGEGEEGRGGGGRAGGLARVTAVYRRMYDVVRLPSVLSLLVVLLTSRVAFVATDQVTVLKLTERGFPVEKMALLAVVQFPFELLFPVLVGRLMSGRRLLDPWLLGYLPRVFMTLVGVALVYWFPAEQAAAGELGWLFYGCLVLVNLAFSLCSNLMFVSQCGFFSSVSDPLIGGTYMTLLNTLANLGNLWPKYFVLRLVDALTCRAGDTCAWLPAGTDGYYVMCAASFAIGLAWFWRMRGTVDSIQSLPPAAWRVSRHRRRASKPGASQV